MSNNKNLCNSQAFKNDEFYTPLPTIEMELQHYTDHFKDKIVYCNCDDPSTSNFVKYFLLNFAKLKLKALYASGFITESGYSLDGQSYLMSAYGSSNNITLSNLNDERERQDI